MLTVAKITASSAAGYADYLEGKAQAPELGDYYVKDGERVEAPGRWVAGARAVGCDDEAPVAGDVLRAMMAVQRPDNGEQLRQVGGSGHAVAALDATFSAPKTVSAVWALADPELREQIETAHEQAIDRALDHAVRHVAMIRQRTDDTITHVRPKELIATSWRHTTARAVGNRLPDPQLHSHVLLHAAVRKDGRVVAIDSRSWLVHRRELGAAYRTELAVELAQLGFEIERGTGRGGRYFELAGLPSELTDRWSSRHHQVRTAINRRLEIKRAQLREAAEPGEREAGRAGAYSDAEERAIRLTAREDRAATSWSRSRKQLVTHRDLDRGWAQEARGAGFPPAALGELRNVAAIGPAVPAAEVVERALTEFEASFAWREARAVALEQAAGVPIEAALGQLKQLQTEQRLVELADGKLTTASHRALERRTVAAASRAAQSEVEEIPPRVVDWATAQLEGSLRASGAGLTDEQRGALTLACAQRQVVVIEGQAGSGKSTVLKAVAQAHQAIGQMIVVTSTSALAAQRLAGELAEVGTTPVCFSTVGLARALDDGRLALNPWVTVIHDEAALASTRELEPILGAVADSGARLVLLGDPEQSHPVGAGGLWSHLDRAATTHDAGVQLSHNVRALDPADRREQKHFRDGEAELALRGYAARDRLHLHDVQPDAEDAALEDAERDRGAGLRTLVVAQTSNDHLDELNARAQAIRREHGELGSTALPLAGRPYRLHAGDEIQIRHTIPHPAVGRLHNGTTARIGAVDPMRGVAELELASGEELELTREQLDHAQARLAYVQHPFPAQGATTDTAHLIAAEHITKEGSYVALTRARRETHIHASRELLDVGADPDSDPVARLAEHMSRSEPDLPSIALPLAHEQAVQAELGRETGLESKGDVARELAGAEHAVGEVETGRGEGGGELDLRWSPAAPEAGPGARVVALERDDGWEL